MSFTAGGGAASAAPGPDAQTRAEGKFGLFLLGADSAGSRLEVLDGGRSVHYAAVQDEKQKHDQWGEVANECEETYLCVGKDQR